MLAHAITMRVAGDRARLERVVAQLAALDPLAILRRGYTMVRDVDNRVLTSALALDADQEIPVQYHDGAVVARVSRVERHSPAGPHATSEDSDNAGLSRQSRQL